MVMGRIHPDLTTDKIDTIEERYTGETPEQKKSRHASYKRAFELFEAFLRDLSMDTEADVKKARQKTGKKRTKKEAAERAGELSDIERKFQSGSL